MQKGERVLIAHSWHSDVVPGTIGTIVKRMRGGYEIKCTGCFHDAFGKSRGETRSLFFATKQIRRLQRHGARRGKGERADARD